MTVAANSRCFDVPECLGDGRREFGDIATQTCPPRGVGHRILSTLTERGMAVQDAEPGFRTAIAPEARAS